MEEPKNKWRVNDIIRNKQTGKPYLVLHVSRYYCTIVEMEDGNKLVPTYTLLPRNFDEYTVEVNMTQKKSVWAFEPIFAL